MKTTFLSLLLSVLLFSLCHAQQFTLKGLITDEHNVHIPFVSIYIKNTSNGTSANTDGLYVLRVNKGVNTIIYKAVGYKPIEKTIDIQENTILNFKLETEAYALNTVNIKAGAEDPAYEIIRKAIKKRKSHLNETDAFTCNVYIKGLQRLLAAPKKFLGKDIQKMANESGLDFNRTGVVYLSESESIYRFQKPNLVQEEMISSKVSGSNRAFSYNRASDLQVNFYENYQNWEGLSLRPLVSPIADNALFYYNYKYLGASTENDLTIYKIEVLPKRSGDPVFKGTIYIVDGLWRLNQVDLFLTKKANINLLDTLNVSQQFIPVTNKKWFPSNTKFEFKGGLLGFKFGGYYMAIYKNYTLDAKKTKKDFNEILRIAKGVNKKDSAYWKEARPVPLTEEEITDYRKKEALAVKRESKPYLDSLDKAHNKFKLSSMLFGSGYTLRNRYKKEHYQFSSLKDAVVYNTVEGFGLNYQASYRKQTDSVNNQYFYLSGKIRYGLALKNFYPSVATNLPLGKYSFSVALGADVLDLNNNGTLSPLGNAFNTLVYGENRSKFYEKKYANLAISGRIYGGLTGSLFTELANRKALLNHTLYTFSNKNTQKLTSNNPFNPSNDIPLFDENQLFKIGFRLSYNFSNKYISYPSGKYYVASKYPTLSLGFQKAIKNILGSDADYNFVYADIAKNDIPLGFYGKFSFMAGAGKFFGANNLYYPDLKHFAGNQSLAYQAKPNSFLFLNYYMPATGNQYVELHASHNFSGFILNKVPLVKKLKLQEIVGINYLSTPSLRNYKEGYFGLQYLTFKAYYGWAFDGKKQVDNGFRITYGF